MDCELICSLYSSRGCTLIPCCTACMAAAVWVSHWKPVTLCCELDKLVCFYLWCENFSTFMISNLDWEISSLCFFSWDEKVFGAFTIFTIAFFLTSAEFLFSFLHLFVIAQIYAPTTCWIPRLLGWRRQMSSFWLAPIHALRHRSLMLEFERGSCSLVVNKHVNPSGFDTVLSWSCRQ